MQANRLPAGRGWQWFARGVGLWRQAPGILGLAAMLCLLVSAVVGSLPWLGSLLVCLVGPFLNVSMLRVCHLVATGQRPAPREIVQAVSIDSPARIRGLLILGGVTFVGLLLGKALMMLLAGDALQQIADASAAMATQPPAGASVPTAAPALPTASPAVLLALFLNLCAVFVLSMVMWIAPALTAFAGVPAVKSLFFSIVVCWRNRGAFVVFGLSVACMSIPMSMLMMLGGVGQMLAIMIIFGVFVPACFGSNYLSVTDIFGPLPMTRGGERHGA